MLGLAASIFSANPQHILQHWTRESVAMRHCSYQLFATSATGADSDFVFTFDPAPAAADAAAGAVVLRSQNFPTKFVSPLPASAKLEPGRLGINDGSAGATAFTRVQGLGSAAPDAVTAELRALLRLNPDLAAKLVDGRAARASS